jgi:hypothetical protein
MKNLRKILAVVLAVCMMFALMATASASFTDASSIKYTTAVGVMTGIGAIDGKPDGSFGPTAPVTRAEAAKMITIAIYGTAIANSLPSVTSSFSDVPTTHWAAKYINYLAAKGIIGGVGDGTFNPDGQVTASQMAKLMLSAAGYGKNNEYVGSAWEINAISDAISLYVFYGTAATDFSKAATKEEAALYIFNAITKVGQVSYNSLFGYYGKGSSVTSPTAGATIAASVYNMVNTKGIVLGGSVTTVNATGTNVVAAGFDTVTGKLISIADPSSSSNIQNFAYDAVKADIGQLVSIYSNSDTGTVYFHETLSGTIANIFGAATPYTYNSLFGSLTYGTANAIIKFVTNYKTPTLATGTPAPLVVDNGTLVVGSNAPTGTYATYLGQIISYNSGGSISFEKVSAISTTTGTESISFAGGTTYSNQTSNDVIKEYSGVAVGDYVTLTRVGDFYYMDKVTTVSGTVSNLAYIIGYPYTYTIDGKTYNATFGVTNNSGLTAASPSLITDFNSNTYTLYLNSAGAVVLSTLTAGANASQVVYVTGPAWIASGDYGNVWKFQAVDTTGTATIYNAGAVTYTSGLPDNTPSITGGFYSVTVNATTKIATAAAATGYSSTYYTTPSGTSTIATTTNSVVVNPAPDSSGNIYYYDANTNFIFVSGTGSDLVITKVTGVANIVGYTLDPTDMVYFNNTTSTNKTINTVIVSHVFTGASSAQVMYVAAEDPISTNTTSYTKNVYMDGVKTKLNFSNPSLSTYAGRFVTYTVDSDGIYTVNTVNTSYTGNDQIVLKSGVYGSNVTIGGTTYNASGATVVDLSQAATDPAVYTSLAAMSSANKTFMVDYVTDSYNVIKTIYVIASGDLYTSANGLVAFATKTSTGTTNDTYTVNFYGTPTASTTITTNGLWGAAQSWWIYWSATRTSDTVITLGAYAFTYYSGTRLSDTITIATGTTPTFTAASSV